MTDPGRPITSDLDELDESWDEDLEVLEPSLKTAGRVGYTSSTMPMDAMVFDEVTGEVSRPPTVDELENTPDTIGTPVQWERVDEPHTDLGEVIEAFAEEDDEDTPQGLQIPLGRAPAQRPRRAAAPLGGVSPWVLATGVVVVMSAVVMVGFMVFAVVWSPGRDAAPVVVVTPPPVEAVEVVEAPPTEVAEVPVEEEAVTPEEPVARPVRAAAPAGDAAAAVEETAEEPVAEEAEVAVPDEAPLRVGPSKDSKEKRGLFKKKR